MWRFFGGDTQMHIDFQELILAKLSDIAKLQIQVETIQQSIFDLRDRNDEILKMLALSSNKQTELLIKLENNLEDHSRLYKRLEENEADILETEEKVDQILANCKSKDHGVMCEKIHIIEHRLEKIESFITLITSKPIIIFGGVVLLIIIAMAIEHLTGFRCVEKVFKFLGSLI